MAQQPKETHAKYMREYRATTKPLNERNAEALGFSRAVKSCAKYFRSRVAGSAITGYQAALMLERAMLEAEPEGTVARARLIAMMQGRIE